MGFLIGKVDRSPAPAAKPARRAEEPETVVHKPSDEGEYWLSQTPRLLRGIRRNERG